MQIKNADIYRRQSSASDLNINTIRQKTKISSETETDGSLIDSVDTLGCELKKLIFGVSKDSVSTPDSPSDNKNQSIFKPISTENNLTKIRLDLIKPSYPPYSPPRFKSSLTPIGIISPSRSIANSSLERYSNPLMSSYSVKKSPSAKLSLLSPPIVPSFKPNLKFTSPPLKSQTKTSLYGVRGDYSMLKLRLPPIGTPKTRSSLPFINHSTAKERIVKRNKTVCSFVNGKTYGMSELKENGFLIATHLVKTAAADKAGLAVGDVFVAFDNLNKKTCSGLDDISKFVQSSVKCEFEVVVFRALELMEGKFICHHLTIEPKPSNDISGGGVIGAVINLWPMPKFHAETN